MKRYFIPVAALAALSFGSAYAAGGVLGGNDTKTTGNVGNAVTTTKTDDGTRGINTPVGGVETKADNGTVGGGANLGTTKSPKVHAGVQARKKDRNNGTPAGADVNAGVTGADQSSQTDRALGK